MFSILWDILTFYICLHCFYICIDCHFAEGKKWFSLVVLILFKLSGHHIYFDSEVPRSCREWLLYLFDMCLSFIFASGHNKLFAPATLVIDLHSFSGEK